MEQVGAAVVGAGHWGERHAYAYHRLPRARLVGICDVDQQRARKLADRYGADSIYERIDDLLDDPKVEIVSIALPDHLHTEAALSCASRGRHILVEKPLALTVEECETVIEAADVGGVRLMVDFANRWNAPFLKDSVSISQRDLVLAAVEGTELSPVASGMASQVVEGMTSCLHEQFQGPRRSYNPPEGERRRHRPLLALKT